MLMFLYTFSLLFLTSVVLGRQKCNGFEDLCGRSLGNVTFIGAHDSFAYDSASTGSTVGVGLSSNQYNNVSQQLHDGVRMLQGQGHHLNSSDDDSTVQLCHSSCSLLNGGTLTAYLEKVVSFLEANPDEVIIFLWVNTEDVFPISSYGNSYIASGMDKYSYAPDFVPVKNTDWPTMEQLISDGKRAISFVDRGADFGSVPYILDEFSMIFETVPDPQENDFTCAFDRPHGGSPDGKMYLVNHNLNKAVTETIVVPNLEAINTTNAACGEHTIETQVNNCLGLYNRAPNIIMLDYYNRPVHDPFEAANYLNRVGPNPCAQDSNPEASSTGSRSASATIASSTSDASPGYPSMKLLGSMLVTVIYLLR